MRPCVSPRASRGRASAASRCARWKTWTPSANAAAPRPRLWQQPYPDVARAHAFVAAVIARTGTHDVLARRQRRRLPAPGFHQPIAHGVGHQITEASDRAAMHGVAAVGCVSHFHRLLLRWHAVEDDVPARLLVALQWLPGGI